MSKTTLSLIVPGLIDPVPYLKELPVQDLPELTIFSSFLSRGTYTRPEQCDYSNNNYYNCLLKQLSLQANFSQLPIASLSFSFDSKTPGDAFDDTRSEATIAELNGKWIMRLDPCFMMPDRDQLVLAKTGNMELSLAEARQLAEEINDFYNQPEDDFWTIKVINPERWYLISELPIDIESVPPEKVIGQSVKPYLFSTNSADSRYWLNLFNEFQMILYKSHINQQRQANKKYPVNSLWFWGQGKHIKDLKLSKNNADMAASSQLYSDNIVAQCMSLVNGGGYAGLPDKYLSSENSNVKHVFYVIDDFSRAIQNRDVFSWLGMLEQFESNYLSHILDDLNSGKINKLEIISPLGTNLLVTKKLLRRWWRKKKNFIFLLS